MHIPIAVIVVYLLLCYLVGLLGKNRKFGFYGYFFASILLTPLMGLILVIASDSQKKREE